MQWRTPGSCVLGAWLRSEKKAWGVHKSLQLYFLDQKHHGIWLSSKDIKVKYPACACVWFIQCIRRKCENIASLVRSVK